MIRIKIADELIVRSHTLQSPFIIELFDLTERKLYCSRIKLYYGKFTFHTTFSFQIAVVGFCYDLLTKEKRQIFHNETSSGGRTEH